MIGHFEHEGYVGLPHVEPEDDVIAGRVLGIEAIVTFEGGTVAEARKAFEDSVDAYLAWCRERGKEPEKPFAGRIKLGVPPDLYRAVALAADAERVSVADFIVKTLKWTLIAQGKLAPEISITPGGETYGELVRRGAVPVGPPGPAHGQVARRRAIDVDDPGAQGSGRAG